MSQRFEEALDECLDALLRGEPVESCIGRYPEHAKELEPLLRIAQVAIASSADPHPELKSETMRSLRLSSQEPSEEGSLEEALSHCIDLLLEGYPVQKSSNLYPQHSRALSPLLQIAASLRQAFAVEARAEFKDMARQRVLNILAQGKSRRSWPRALIPRWSYRWAVAASLIVVIVLTGTVTVRASSETAPGDLLYPVKEFTEKVELMLATSTSKEARLHAKLANRRAQEMVDVAMDGDYEKVEELADKLILHLEKVSLIIQEQQKEAAIKMVFQEEDLSTEGLPLDDLRAILSVLDQDTRATDVMFKDVLMTLPPDMQSEMKGEFQEAKAYYRKTIQTLEFKQSVDDMNLFKGRGLAYQR
ncbi:MAG: DUF5667 domain-containing protein [Dehalococcoidia bacterium]